MATQQTQRNGAFTLFTSLPTELRRSIWSFASPRRSRVIQVYYHREDKSWQASKNGCGGLPSTVHVCREARIEALKTYTRICGVYFDLAEDTLFVVDPIFSLQKQRMAFMEQEFLPKLRHIAFSDDIYNGLARSHWMHPTLCDSPVDVILAFQHLEYFLLVLLEDGAGFNFDEMEAAYYDDPDESAYNDENYEEDVEMFLQYKASQEGDAEEGGELTVGHDTIEGVDCKEIKLRDLYEEKLYKAMANTGFIGYQGNLCFERASRNSLMDPANMAIVSIQCGLTRSMAEYTGWLRPVVDLVAVKHGLIKLEGFS